jgi:hypothetical protein
MTGSDVSEHDAVACRRHALDPRAWAGRVVLIASMLVSMAGTNALHAQSVAQQPAPRAPFAPDLSSIGTRVEARLQDGRKSHRLAGAAIGFVVGAGATYLALNSGGSTSKCDRDANQDALSSGECLGLYALGGLAGAGLGAIVGGFIRTGGSDFRRIDGFGLGMTRDRAVVVGLRLPH